MKQAGLSANGIANHAFDLVILGGGCAGLSLAARLAAAASPLRVALVETRDRYAEDRTWCGWRLEPHFFEDCRVAEWNRWHLARAGQVLQRSSNIFPYEMINAGLVYDKALHAIDRSRSISLLLGVRATKLLESAERVEIELAGGQSLSARWVVDTRPEIVEIKHPWLWQSFVGLVVEIEGPEKAWERSLPMLMDFQSDAPGPIDFLYILPVGGRSYLCEYTRFSPRRAAREELDARLAAWLSQHAGSGWKPLRREAGDLPMAKMRPYSTERIVHAGTRGGSMRAATGYAFHNIQRWAEECARSLLLDGRPVGPREHRLLDWMDELFLRVLQRPDVVADRVMWSLFAESEPDSLVRFLSGQPGLGDYWPVVKGLPWGKFVATAARTFASRERAE